MIKKILIFSCLCLVLTGCNKKDVINEQEQAEKVNIEIKAAEKIISAIGVQVLFGNAEFPMTEIKGEGYEYDDMMLELNNNKELTGHITINGTEYKVEKGKVVID